MGFEPIARTPITMGYDPDSSQQPAQLSPDASEAQWLSDYNERLLLTVQSVHRLHLAFMSKYSP